MEYCGEVISWKEAKRRSQAYENQGLLILSSLNVSMVVHLARDGNRAIPGGVWSPVPVPVQLEITRPRPQCRGCISPVPEPRRVHGAPTGSHT